MTELAEFGSSRGNFEQDAASSCNSASQKCYKHPWCSQSHGSSVVFLPPLIGNFFEDDDVARRHDLMDLAPMQALTMHGKFTFLFRLATARSFVVFTPFPAQFLVALLFDTALCIIVLWIGRTTLPIHLALQATDGLGVRSQFFAEDGKARFACAGHQRDGRRADRPR